VGKHGYGGAAHRVRLTQHAHHSGGWQLTKSSTRRPLAGACATLTKARSS